MEGKVSFSHNNGGHRSARFSKHKPYPSASTIAYMTNAFPSNQEDEKSFLAGVLYCILNKDAEMKLMMGFAECHPDDQFSRKTGREISESSMKEVTIKDLSIHASTESPEHNRVDFEVDHNKRTYTCVVRRSPKGTWFINEHYINP
jgi:hypothetical protein